MALETITRQFVGPLGKLAFAGPVACVYHPLEYAWESAKLYLELYGSQTPREVLMLGMNPGPWGMAQTGVPFGEVSKVKDWMGIHVDVKKPAIEHPKRPID